MTAPEALLQKNRNLVPFDKVRNRIAEEHELKMPDTVIDLKKMETAGLSEETGLLVEVPKLGRLTMTAWAQKQLGQTLGIKWDQWFPKEIDPREINQEIQRRFQRLKLSAKIRAKRFSRKAPGVKGCDGYIRAFLSPGYSPIDDEIVFDRMERKFGSNVADVGFMQNHLGTDFFTDRTSMYMVASEPVRLGPLNRQHPDQRIRELYDMAERTGDLPDGDWAYQGFSLRNSEVGCTALSMASFMFRLVCNNGMVVNTGGGQLLYRTHRKIDAAGIDGLLGNAFSKLKASWQMIKGRIDRLQGKQLEQPVEDLRDFLTKAKVPQKFIDLAVAAFEIEPLPNAYGVMNAITRAAQQIEGDPEKRAKYEELAGAYTTKFGSS